MKGKVKFFNRGKGFGFVQGDDGKDYFVHYTALREGVNIDENDSVTFDPVEGDRGWKAENVELASGDDSAEEAPAEESAEEEAPAEESTEEETPAEEPAEEEAPAEEEKKEE